MKKEQCKVFVVTRLGPECSNLRIKVAAKEEQKSSYIDNVNISIYCTKQYLTTEIRSLA